jgi:hypothetical protein
MKGGERNRIMTLEKIVGNDKNIRAKILNRYTSYINMVLDHGTET